MHGQVRVRGDALVSAAGHLEARARIAGSHLADCARVPTGLLRPGAAGCGADAGRCRGRRLRAGRPGPRAAVDQGAGRGRGLPAGRGRVRPAADERCGHAALPARPPGGRLGAATRCARLAAAADRLADDLVHDAELLADAWAGAAARMPRRARSRPSNWYVGWSTRCTGRRPQLRVHADVVGEARSAVDDLRGRYDDLVAGQRRETSRLLRDAELVGPFLRLQLRGRSGRPAGRAGGAAPPAPRGTRPGRRARAARPRGRSSVAPTRSSRDRVPAGARSTRARASSPHCCRCWPRPGGAAGIGAGPPPAARRRTWPGSGGRCSPPTSSSGRCTAGRARSARSTGSPAPCAVPPTSTASTSTSRCS